MMRPIGRATSGNAAATAAPTRLGVSDPVSLAGPTPEDRRATDALEVLLRARGLYEDDAGRQLRERVLGKLNELVTAWLQSALRAKGLSPDVVAAAALGPKIFTFGSYRLGVHGQGSDIDTLCIGPRQVERAEFFTGLVPLLQARPETADLVAVPDA